MSRIKLLMDVVEDMRSLAESVETLAKAMASDEEPVEDVKVEKKEEKKAKAEEPEKKYTKDEVRAKLSAISSAGKTEEVKNLLTKHGAKNLSSLKEEEYTAIMKEAEEL